MPKFNFAIKKTAAGWHVLQIAEGNSEPLNSTEVLESHENALNNIRAVYTGMDSFKAVVVVDYSIGQQGWIKRDKNGRVVFRVNRQIKTK